MNPEALRQDLELRLGCRLGSCRVRPVGGGDINRALILETAEDSLFVKYNRADRLAMFEAERLGLETIAASASIRVPRALATGCCEDHAFLALEYIELRGNPAPEALAAALAAMHACSADAFGFDGDNTIGSTPQSNRWNADWIEFWREQRLGAQLRFGAESGRFGRELLDRGARLGENLAALFADYRPQPALLHGDLWSGNWAADSAGRPVIYDPACYFGDHETDLAMMELFGAPGARFFSEYHEHFAIDAGYALRRDLYNLYHLLNHANLFGGGYAAQSLAVVNRLLAAL